MKKILDVVGGIFSGLGRVIAALCSCFVDAVVQYPRFFLLLAAAGGFYYALHYVPGFGELAAEVFATFLVVTVIYYGARGKKKKR